MPWRPLPSIAHAVCIHHFEATEPDDLALQVGDEVYITEVNGPKSHWCRGWLLAQPSVLYGLSLDDGEPLRPQAYSGIFPRDCVELRELLPDQRSSSVEAVGGADDEKDARRSTDRRLNGQDTSAPPPQDEDHVLRHVKRMSTAARRLQGQTSTRSRLKPIEGLSRAPGSQKEQAPLPTLRVGESSTPSEPLVEDISSCIREWHSEKLHKLILEHDYTTLDKLADLLDKLHAARRQFTHDLLTEKELAALRERTIWDLVKGNKMVDGGVIVRSPKEKGRMLTAEDSLPNILELQAMTSLRDSPVQPVAKAPNLFHVLVDLQELPRSQDESAILHMFLVSALADGKARTVSETFAVALPMDGPLDSVALPEALARTLFTNLGRSDIGSDAGTDSRLCLVCKLYKDEPFRRESRKASTNPSVHKSEGEDQTSRPSLSSGSKRGKRTFMLNGQVARRGSDASQADDDARPSTTGALRRKLSRQHLQTSSTVSSDMHSRPSTAEKRLRRAAGWAVVDLTGLIHQRSGIKKTVALWTPTQALDGLSNEQQPVGEGWDDLIRSLCRSPSGSFTRSLSFGQFSLRVQGFAHDVVDVMIKEKPALLQDVHCTNSLALNGVSQLPRSDVYLTLKEPAMPVNAQTYHPSHGSVPIRSDTDYRNLQITLEVRTESGQRIESCIYPTSNRMPHTAFRTPAVDKGEAWNQTIRVSMHPDDLPNAHIVMSIADGPQFPFALAWVPLWDEKNGFPPNGQQRLALWDYSEYTVNTVDGRGAYQALPARIEDMAEQYNSAMASITIEMLLSSTSSTQNGDILALLHKGRTSPKDIIPSLKRFNQVPDDEIVKFFGPLLEALSNVLHENIESDGSSDASLEDELVGCVLKCLIHCLQLTRDRRYPDLQRQYEGYLEQRIFTPAPRLAVMRGLRSLLSRPYDGSNGRGLRAALKVADQLLRFAVHCTPSVQDSLDTKYSKQLHYELREFFEDAMVLLTTTNSLALGTQTIIVQNFASWLPVLVPAIAGEQVLGLAIAVVDACSFGLGQLRLHRLSMILNIISLAMFQSQDMRSKLISRTITWLGPYWPETFDTGDRAISGIRMCCTIIRQQTPNLTDSQAQQYIVQLFDAYHKIQASSVGDTASTSKAGNQSANNKAFSSLFPASYPFQTVAVDSDRVPKEVLLEISAVLGALFQNRTIVIPSPTNQPSGLDAGDVRTALHVLRSIRNGEAFPADWLTYSVALSRRELDMLEWALAYMQHTVPDSGRLPDADDVMEFDETLWSLWFDGLFALAQDRSVVLENHSEQKRRAVWAIGGDIRETAAALLLRAWTSLGWENEEEAKALYGLDRMSGYQVQFTASLIPSVISIGLGLHSALRYTAVEILRSMIVGEWELSGNLEIVQASLTDACDFAFRNQRFATPQAEAFLENVMARFQSLERSGASPLYRAVRSMLEEVGRLLERLSALNGSKDGDPAVHLEQQVLLLDFLRTSHSEDSYVRHLHDVAEWHIRSHNYAAAGLALQLYVDMLEDNDDESSVASGQMAKVAKAYPELGLPSETAPLRVQRLLARMIKLYKTGHCWSHLRSALEERNRVLKSLYDSAGLTKAHVEQAAFYTMLQSGVDFRIPRYFKVVFGTQGFQPTVLGKTFIFEGTADDDTEHFAKEMKRQYPSAMVLHPGVAAPNAAAAASTLRISNVSVNRDQLHHVNRMGGVSPFFKVFELTSEPVSFATSTRQERPGVGVLDQTVQKTVYHTKQQFPTLLGRSEIVEEEEVLLTPLQAAIDRTHRKTLDIAEATRDASRSESHEADRLARLIRNSVDPAAADSVATYHRLLQGGRRSNRTSTISSSTSKYSETGGGDDTEILERILTVALEDHARNIEQALQSCFDNRRKVKQELRQNLEITFDQELFTLYPSGQWRTESAAWADREPEAGTGHNTRIVDDNADASDTDTGGKRRSSRRRSSIRKTLSFLSISKA